MISILFVFLLNISWSQNPEGFEEMCKDTLSGTVQTASSEQLRKKSAGSSPYFCLDTRELNEFNVSHIEHAIHVGYDQFNINSLNGFDRKIPVYLYCSIGYRSEKIGEKLIEAGFTEVYNLFGGIFNWFNNGYDLYDNENKRTKKVHGYDKEWSKWLNKKRGEIVLN